MCSSHPRAIRMGRISLAAELTGGRSKSSSQPLLEANLCVGSAQEGKAASRRATVDQLVGLVEELRGWRRSVPLPMGPNQVDSDRQLTGVAFRRPGLGSKAPRTPACEPVHATGEKWQWGRGGGCRNWHGAKTLLHPGKWALRHRGGPLQN